MSLNPLLSIVAGIAALLSLPGTVELIFLTLGAWLFRDHALLPAESGDGLNLRVLVPAHDESAGISACVAGLLACERGPHRVEVVVVADNCTDDTARKAASAGARVLERFDPEKRGKGHALAFAFDRLMDEEPDAFIIVDADSRVEANFIVSLAGVLAQGADGVQCRYLAENPDDSFRTRIQHIAWLAFNDLRLKGREFWGCSVGILGNGFALARRSLEKVPFDADSIAEDLEYHLRLIRAGGKIRYCPATTLWSAVPQSSSAAAGQRARWEGGRFRMIIEQVPGLGREILQGKWTLIEPWLELLLLPLAFHVLLVLLALLAEGWARDYAIVALGVIAWHVLSALWLGKAELKYYLALAAAPVYILWKLTLGGRLLAFARRNAPWIRTER